jgi:hypothetical protein
MANTPKKAAQKIAQTTPNLIWHHCLATDPVIGWPWHQEVVLQLDPATRNTVMAAKLEAEAQIHRTLADASTKIASALKSRG